jgi:hypothetical protein
VAASGWLSTDAISRGWWMFWLSLVVLFFAIIPGRPTGLRPPRGGSGYTRTETFFR